MKAIAYRRYGGVEVLETLDQPQPTPAPGQILVRVKNASVNPIDWKLASGALRLLAPARFPEVPGFDVAGEVVSIGPAVTTFAVGDRVHARLDDRVGASCAEYTLAGLNVTTRMPERMDFATAAGLPLAGMTALQALRRCGLPMQDAKARVLVVGASGGVGHLAVQIARACGAHVVGVCSARNAAQVQTLGAQEVLDYTKPDPYAGQAPFDIVLDCVGGSPAAFLPLLTAHGHFASVMPRPLVFFHSALSKLRSRKVHAILLKATAADLAILDDLFTRGALRVVIDSRFPLDDLKGAWTRSMSGRATGKILIDVA